MLCQRDPCQNAVLASFNNVYELAVNITIEPM